MIITTTNSIENSHIEKYLGVVTANLVLGTNFFSEFSAAFTDFFGGMSGPYGRKMDTLYQKAYDVLSLKASAMGANCILGFKIDFDELSGKGMQMFMVSVSGTAVILNHNNSALSQSDFPNTISNYKLNIELFKENWNKRTQSKFPTEQELNYIIINNLWELAPSLYNYYVAPKYVGCDSSILSKFPQIISLMNYDDVVSFIYEDYPKRKAYALPLIQENKLFSAENILKLLHENYISEAIDLLETEKNQYTNADLKVMEEIVTFINKFPDKGKIEETKSGLLSSKLVEKYICPNGHKNDKEVEYCGECWLNIKGLQQSQVVIIDAFKDKVRMIKTLLDK